MWRKSSRSGPNGDCVELRDDLTALRDSKRPEVELLAGPGAVSHLVFFARGGKPATA